MYNIVLFILLGAIINASTNASTNTSNNMCKINKHKYLCGNNLNYNRNIMPQYNSTHHYYNSDIYTIHSSKLIPSQNEINLDKVMYLYHNYNNVSRFYNKNNCICINFILFFLYFKYFYEQQFI